MANSGPTTEPNEVQFIEMNKNLERISGRFERQETVNKEQMKSLENTLTKSINNLGKFTAQSVKDVARAVHQEVNLGSRESVQRGGGAAGGLVGVVAMKAIQDSKVAQNTIAVLKDKLSKKFSRKKGPYRISDEVYDQGDENLPKAATGGFVKRTGKAIVHAGEKITRKSTVDAHLQTLQMIQSSLQSIQATQVEMVSSLNSVQMSLTDPSAAGGFFKSVGDTAKVLIPLFGGGMYKNDIKKSGNPFATMTDALLEIYRWQRLYGELSKRQLNELIKASGGEQQDVYGKRGVLFEFMIKNRTKILDKLAAHIKKKEGEGKKPIFAKAAKGVMGSWIGKALMQDPEMFEMANREAALAHGSKMLKPGKQQGPEQSLGQKIGSWTIFGQKETVANHKLMKKSFGSEFTHESLHERPETADIYGRADQAGVNLGSLGKLRAERDKLLSKTIKDPKASAARDARVAAINKHLEKSAKSVWAKVMEAEKASNGGGQKATQNNVKSSEYTKTGKDNFAETATGKQGSSIFWLQKIYNLLKTGSIGKSKENVTSNHTPTVNLFKPSGEGKAKIKRKGKFKDITPEDSLSKISESTSTIADLSKKTESRSATQAKDAKKSAIWDKVKEKGKGGISKVFEFVNSISGMLFSIVPLIGAMVAFPKATVATLKWAISSPLDNISKLLVMFSKFSKLFTLTSLWGGLKALYHLPKTLKSMFGVVKGVFNVFKSAGSLFKGLSAVGKVAGKGIGKGIMGAAGKAFAKKIPGVGAILGIMFGINRFRKGDIIGGIGEIASGIASIFPGPGTVISLLIDGLLIAKDIHEEKTGQSMNAQIGDIALHSIPGIGSIMYMFEGVKKWKNGDKKGALIDFASGFGAIIPGVGPLIHGIASWLTDYKDVSKEKKDASTTTKAKQEGESNVLASAGGPFKPITSSSRSFDAATEKNKLWAESNKSRQTNDYIGAAREVTTASGQRITLSPGDIATVKKGQPSIAERNVSNNLAEGARQNAVSEQLNNSAATVRASKQLGGSIARSSEASTNNINNVVNKVTKVSTNNTSSGGGGGPTKLPLWQDLSFLLAGTNI